MPKWKTNGRNDCETARSPIKHFTTCPRFLELGVHVKVGGFCLANLTCEPKPLHSIGNLHFAQFNSQPQPQNINTPGTAFHANQFQTFYRESSVCC